MCVYRYRSTFAIALALRNIALELRKIGHALGTTFALRFARFWFGKLQNEYEFHKHRCCDGLKTSTICDMFFVVCHVWLIGS